MYLCVYLWLRKAMSLKISFSRRYRLNVVYILNGAITVILLNVQSNSQFLFMEAIAIRFILVLHRKTQYQYFYILHSSKLLSRLET